MKFKILLVEDDKESQEISKEILKSGGYEVDIVGRGDTAIEKIKQINYDLVLLDVMLPGKDGFSVLEEAKKNAPFTPVIMLTVLKERKERIKAYELGADDFINKPFDRWEFLARVRSLLNLRKTYLELETRENLIKALSSAIEAKDPYTKGHSERVGEYSKKLALKLGFDREKAESLYWAGILHDIGKIAIPIDILTKPGKLTDEEFEKIKVHPVISYKICESLNTLKQVLPAVKHHHERYDGKGYPNGLKGEEIPYEARIMAVTDSFDAMTSDRSYRKAMPKEKAIEILKQGAGVQWDEKIVKAFIELIKK